jgi:hypothetical protein
LATNIVALALTAGGSAAIKMTTVPVRLTTQQLAQTSGRATQAIKDVSKDVAEEVAMRLGEQVVNSAYNNQPIDWSALDPTGIAAVVKAFSRQPC